MADGPAADALLLGRRRRGRRLRARRVRAGDDVDRYARDVVAVRTGTAVGAVAVDLPARLALCDGADRLLRRIPALVPRRRPADVLFLRHADGTVSYPGVWPGPLPGSRQCAGRMVTLGA